MFSGPLFQAHLIVSLSLGNLIWCALQLSNAELMTFSIERGLPVKIGWNTSLKKNLWRKNTIFSKLNINIRYSFMDNYKPYESTQNYSFEIAMEAENHFNIFYLNFNWTSHFWRTSWSKTWNHHDAKVFRLQSYHIPPVSVRLCLAW